MNEELKNALVKSSKVIIWTVVSAAMMGLISYLSSGEVNASVVAWSPLLNAMAFSIKEIAMKNAKK